MAKAELVKLTNMCMVCDGKGNVLVQNRNDPNWPGMTFPGGHVEPGESFVDSVIREVKEETGLTVEDPVLCGIKHFHTMDNTRYVVFLFKARKFSGSLRSSEEGTASWIPIADMDRYTWIPDFQDLLEIFQKDDISELFYYRQDEKLNRVFK